MSSTSANAPTVLETILAWSLNRPLWQRDAVRRIVQNGSLDDKDISELTVLCQKEVFRLPTTLQAEPLEKKHLPSNPGAGSPVNLLEIKDVSGVNRLAPGQHLKLAATGLTIIYGDNGTGKSGYARILKRACQTRNPGNPLIGNVYATPSAIVGQQATILYEIGGTPQPPLIWRESGAPDSVLSAVGVFDSSCASIHIGSKNEVVARPFGLDVPDILADGCKRIEAVLKDQRVRLDNARQPTFTKPAWRSTTVVGKALSGLSVDTDLQGVTTLAQLSTVEVERLQQLKQDLNRDSAVGARELRLNVRRTRTLIAMLKSIADAITDKSFTDLRNANVRAEVARSAAQVSADTLFAGSPLAGVTSPVWKELWEAARRYSEQIAYPSLPFPPVDPDQLCLLCQQPLGAEATERMRNFESFIRAETQQQAEAAERDFARRLAALSDLKLSLMDQPEGLRELAVRNKPLYWEVCRFLAAARLRRFRLLRSLAGEGDAGPIVAPPLGPLEQEIQVAESRAAELETLVDPAERLRWQAELDELIDRRLLSTILAEVQTEFTRLVTIAVLDECCKATNTTAITVLGNKIADDVVTPLLRDRFLDEVIALVSNKVRVEFVRCGGRYGSPQYQVKLLSSPDANILDVLSEGEQTCIALAAFLTEVSSMSHKSALVFDDPVTSLDHQWRKKVAERLVLEAAERQIVVFTHDLVFVNDLYDLASQNKLSQTQVTVMRGAAGTGVVTDGLPWQGKRVEDRLDKLGQSARAAKVLFDSSRDEEYKEEVVKIYNNLRNTWERALEEIAFAGVLLRHRDYIATQNLKKTSALTEQDCEQWRLGFKKCCDVTDAHDPSAGRNASPPAPSEILKDIKDLADWVASLRARQKAM